MEKKVEIDVGGRKIRVMEHMVSDMLKFGATKVKKIFKDVPKELLTIPEAKKIEVLPEMKKTIIEPLKKEETKADVLPEMVTNQEIVPEPEKKTRKAPVKSKAKK